MEGDQRAVKALVEAMFGEDPELRKRAADVVRRITEHNPEPLKPYADELAGLLAEYRSRNRARGGTWGWWSRV